MTLLPEIRGEPVHLNDDLIDVIGATPHTVLAQRRAAARGPAEPR